MIRNEFAEMLFAIAAKLETAEFGCGNPYAWRRAARLLLRDDVDPARLACAFRRIGFRDAAADYC